MRLLLPLALLTFSASLGAQSPNVESRVVRLADGVYAIIHPDATTDWSTNTTDWPNSNVGVIIGDQAVLVTDSDYLPSQAKADIALIRKLTDKPVRFLVNTHWHGDHTHGNSVYRESFPGISIVGARANRDYIEINQARFPSFMAPQGLRARQLHDLERLLAAGADSAGRAFSTSEIARLALNIAQRRQEIEELSNLKVAPPTLLFDTVMRIDLGNRVVVLHNRGRANSPDDVTIYVPREKVLFSGDILVHPVPYAFRSHPTHWSKVLRELEAIPIVALVPGHGPVQHDHTYTRLVRELMDSTIARTRGIILRAGTVDSVKKNLDLSDFRSRFVQPDDTLARVLWDESIKDALAGRAYYCSIGYDC
jgi:glyoxylase-like metal-dependent hydrolase (beta-lactamase superfamily II)